MLSNAKHSPDAQILPPTAPTTIASLLENAQSILAPHGKREVVDLFSGLGGMSKGWARVSSIRFKGLRRVASHMRRHVQRHQQ